MLTVIQEADGERVLTARIREAMIDTELISGLGSVLDDVERGGIENFALLFTAARSQSPGISHRGHPVRAGATCGISPAGMNCCPGFPG